MSANSCRDLKMERFQLISNLFSTKFCRTFEITSKASVKKVLNIFFTLLTINKYLIYSVKNNKNCKREEDFQG